MSEKKFKIGDKVRAIKPVGGYEIGAVKEVVKELHEGSSVWIDDTRCEVDWLNRYFSEDFELVQEEQKAMQAQQSVQITDEMILVVLEKLDAYARGYDPCEFGLPLYSEYKGEMVLIVKEALGILTERDKQIKQLQDIAGIDREQAEKLIEAGIIANVIGGNV